MNMSTSQDPNSLFLNLLVCTNVEYDKDFNAVARNILVNSELKKRENGETNRIKFFSTEEERLETLKRLFGIGFSPEDQKAIKGHRLAIENFDPHTKQSAF